MANKQVMVGKKEGFGVGLFVIGLIMLLLPGMAQQIADLEFIEAAPFGITTGAVLVLAVIIMVAGVILTLTKFDPPPSEEEMSE